MIKNYFLRPQFVTLLDKSKQVPTQQFPPQWSSVTKTTLGTNKKCSWLEISLNSETQLHWKCLWPKL